MYARKNGIYGRRKSHLGGVIRILAVYIGFVSRRVTANEIRVCYWLVLFTNQETRHAALTSFSCQHKQSWHKQISFEQLVYKPARSRKVVDAREGIMRRRHGFIFACRVCDAAK